ncbi:pilus-assembly fibrillin subunit [Photobacterium phosphoreum]|uniref:pilus-assembly fibrillin subunit n=1 Tax=Photobacterium phosphoreum TaxID=659 RepID=UPI0024B67096|nr:pilus-assembly fibrillin subunit [Photobacterium phosphoreum]
MKTTVVISLVSFFIGLTYSSVSSANSIIAHPEFIVIDETRHQRINDMNGRTGFLEISGALVTSPCSLLTNDISLPSSSIRSFAEGDRRYPIELKLIGCGDGAEFLSPIAATIDSKMITGSQLFAVTGRETGVGPVQALLVGGVNNITYYLSAYQKNKNATSPDMTMALKLTYQ